jgi:hypothetical protein
MTTLTSGAGHSGRLTRDLDACREAAKSNASPLVDPRDDVYELRRLAAVARAQADQLHAGRALIASDRWHLLGRRLEHAAWELDRSLRRSRPTQ